jgi:hypothetical protein
MAKGNPNSATVQYKVHLKPTDIGLLVMKRMERPHLDKSAELRRLIELGYAAEQAGFILDGTVLRHGGRVWDVQPQLSTDALPRGPSATSEGGSATVIESLTGMCSDRPHVTYERPPSVPAVASTSTKTSMQDDAKEGSPMRANLRNLSS